MSSLFCTPCRKRAERPIDLVCNGCRRFLPSERFALFGALVLASVGAAWLFSLRLSLGGHILVAAIVATYAVLILVRDKQRVPGLLFLAGGFGYTLLRAASEQGLSQSTRVAGVEIALHEILLILAVGYLYVQAIASWSVYAREQDVGWLHAFPALSAVLLALSPLVPWALPLEILPSEFTQYFSGYLSIRFLLFYAAVAQILFTSGIRTLRGGLPLPRRLFSKDRVDDIPAPVSGTSIGADLLRVISPLVGIMFLAYRVAGTVVLVVLNNAWNWVQIFFGLGQRFVGETWSQIQHEVEIFARTLVALVRDQALPLFASFLLAWSVYYLSGLLQHHHSATRDVTGAIWVATIVVAALMVLWAWLVSSEGLEDSLASVGTSNIYLAFFALVAACIAAVVLKLLSPYFPDLVHYQRFGHFSKVGMIFFAVAVLFGLVASLRRNAG